MFFAAFVFAEFFFCCANAYKHSPGTHKNCDKKYENKIGALNLFMYSVKVAGVFLHIIKRLYLTLQKKWTFESKENFLMCF